MPVLIYSGPDKKYLQICIQALHSVSNLPSVSIEEETRKCYSAFYRCCSSHSEIPQRCFEMNNCIQNFDTLKNYNKICQGIHPDEHFLETDEEVIVKQVKHNVNNNVK